MVTYGGFLLSFGRLGGVALQAGLILTGAALALGFSSVVTHALVGVPVRHAADASGLLTTTIQLGQAVGVAVFGSLFLTLDTGRHGAALGVAAVAAIPLPRVLTAASRGDDYPGA